MPDYQNPTTITQQFDQLKSSAETMVGNASATLKTAAADLQQAVGGIADKLAEAGASLTAVAKQSLDQLGEFTTVTKFKDVMGIPNKLQELTPEALRNKITSPAGQLQYPKDLGKYFIKFTFKNYYKNNPIVPRQELPSVSIFLPLPSELNERIGVQYSDKQLGALGVLEASGALQGISQSGTGVTEQNMKDMGNRVGQAAATPGNAVAIGGAATGLSDSSIGTAVSRTAGAVLNPFQALQFQGVDLRSHSFRFRCSPNSAEEAADLKKIIIELKKRMLPEKSQLMFTFPDVCTIEFNNRNMPYSFKNCYLKSMSVNYAPQGTPAFFKGGKYTAEVDIQLEFGEIEPLSRNDYMSNPSGDVTGNVGEGMGKPMPTTQEGKQTSNQAASKG